MGKRYSHLQPETRLQIYELLFQGMTIADIANTVSYHRSTIYRELERTSGQQGYRPDWASQSYLARRRKPFTRVELCPELRDFIIDKLAQNWSPGQIAGRLKYQHGRTLISCEAIYRFIYSPAGMKLKLYSYLQEKRKFRYPRIKRRRKTIAKLRKNSIHDRTAEINLRQSFGHWEGDLIVFKHTKTNLFTLRERKSRLVLAMKNPSRKADVTFKTLANYMKNDNSKMMHSLTLDNDSAFALHEDMTHHMGMPIYFCEPYKSYQKGAIENANKLLRQQWPRGTNIDDINQIEIDRIIKKLNDKPMKCLHYKTPNEVFYSHFGQLPF